MAFAKGAKVQNFINCNGYLRVIILVIGGAQLGLILGKYGAEPPEVYQLVVVSSFLGFTAVSILSYVMEAGRTFTETFKVMDYSIHAYGAWFLVNSSLAKFLTIKNLQERPTSGQQAILYLSIILGLVNAWVYAWLAFVTHENRQGLPCFKSAEVGDVDTMPSNGNVTRAKSKRKPLFETTRNSGKERWSWDRCCTGKKVLKRLRWTTLFDGGSCQQRLFTTVMGLATVIFMSRTYLTGYLYDEYFLSMAWINFSVTCLMHITYLIGLAESLVPGARLFDYTFHCSHGVFLGAGATMAMSNTIALGGSQIYSLLPDRTCASVLGICNGALYLLIGMGYRPRPEERKKENPLGELPLPLEHFNEEDHEFTAAMNVLNNRNLITRDSRDKNNANGLPPSRQTRTALIFDPTKM